ncbi:lasso peptide biosynthesis PqqD family chaperone [Marinitenerispora sediminis]|uniref:Lasso peptide biosynthesis PqqD family chaperone n=1 Tax=Marinitenerispora sediminis TaxID=1931232 RepID=A0A368T5Q6_9ACTN|nr:lasso peptide biosynthesis PqqD family chaperone [Marinitenerispora sediminis]RCV52253.1 lasso peptide biosynthesis PqqD family chaperone [Marinitenerispora sediminis]RCV56882.1 lasso peptide biosynthesis PqqD family chaperone [Marinitenerispora sediminis]RCV59041.1 lasso peptide biosynthesis PqqD family chaperone [Marinitenerispora sediminis]
MTLALRADVSAADTGEGMVLLDERTGRYYQLNGTGAMITRLLLDGCSAEEAAGRVADRYPVHPDRAAVDVRRLLASLRRAGLVAP